MAKKVMAQIKLQVEAGKANPSPPIGPALGQHGVNIMDFCKAFNARTANDAGMIIPASLAVRALNALQKSIILTPCCPRAGPIGGEGFALPAST